MLAPKFNHRPRHERLANEEQHQPATTFGSPMWSPGLDPDFDGMGLMTSHSVHLTPGLDALYGEDFAAPTLYASDRDRHSA